MITVAQSMPPQACDPETYTLKAFAERHHMSLSRLYELIEMGYGPSITCNGRRRIITREAASAWRLEWNGKALPSRPRRSNEVD